MLIIAISIQLQSKIDFFFSYKKDTKSSNKCRVFHKTKFEEYLLLNSNSSR